MSTLAADNITNAAGTGGPTLANGLTVGTSPVAAPSGSAPSFMCRAWVNFDGTSNSANLTGTYSQTGTTVTVTITAHGYITGNSAYLDFTTGTAVDGAYTVTVVDANTFTVTQASRTTSGNVTDRRCTIRGSGNVVSVADNGTGDYTVNFAVAMPDANYAVCANSVGNAQQTGPFSDTSLTTSTVRIGVYNSIANPNDYAVTFVAIFR